MDIDDPKFNNSAPEYSELFRGEVPYRLPDPIHPTIMDTQRAIHEAPHGQSVNETIAGVAIQGANDGEVI